MRHIGWTTLPDLRKWKPWWRQQMEAFFTLMDFVWGIHCTKASDAELWCFRWSAPEIHGWVNNWRHQTPSRSWRHCNGIQDRPFQRRTMILKACFSISCCWYVSFESVLSELLYVSCFVSGLFFHMVLYFRTLVNTTSKRGLHFDFEPW